MEQENKQLHVKDSSLPDLEALKGKLEQREALKLKAEQLRESTLSRIKAREKASRRPIVSKLLSAAKAASGDGEKEKGGGSAGRKMSAANVIAKEKSNQLKRKLEEARARIESQRGQESLGRVNEVVESIRVQLEDREKVIQELLTIHSARPPATPIEPEPMETLPDIPDEIKQKIADLEAQVLDLQENVKEKESVISARTQAITLLSEDMARKSKARLDSLEETQEQMRQMQRNFIAIEERMRDEQAKLKEQAEERKQKCLQAEKSLRLVEAARFELSTRVAELTEKVVALQERNVELENGAKQAEALKMKTLEEQKKERDDEKRSAEYVGRRSLEEEGEEVSRLQNRVAELEEEKGNLQLSLVDFDEHQELCNNLKSRVEELENKLKQRDNDLDSHVKALARIESEKLDLIQAVDEMNRLRAERENVISRLERQLSEAERIKVSAEMRAVELEEKLDLGICERRRADSEERDVLENMRNEMLKQEETIRELSAKLADRLPEQDGKEESSREKAVRDLEADLEEWKRKYFELETRYGSADSVYRSLDRRLGLAEEQHELVTGDCQRLRAAVSDLEATVMARTAGRQGANSSDSDETTVVSLRQELLSANLELVRLRELEARDSEKDDEIDRLREELSAVTGELRNLQTVLENMQTADSRLDELNKTIEEKDRALLAACDQLEKRTRKLSEYKKFHKLKSEDVLRVSHELETVSAAGQERISLLEDELARSEEAAADLRRRLEEKEKEAAPPAVSEQKVKKLAASLKLKAKALKECEARIGQLEEKLEESVAESRRLTADRDDAVRCIEEKQAIVEGLTSQEKKVSSEAAELKSWVAELQSQITAKAREAEEAIRGLEKEAADGKAEVARLEKKLSDLTVKYDHSCAKLQEKEAYIESVEAELNKNRERVQLIESSIEERRKSLEEKAEVLGVRLLNAETANREFEKHEGELERQLALFVENENFLQRSLVEMKRENGELKGTAERLAEANGRLETEAESAKVAVSNLQRELAIAREARETYGRQLEAVERVEEENRQLKAGKERLIASFEGRERQTLENMDEELKMINEKMTALESERQELFSRMQLISDENSALRLELEKAKMVSGVDLESQRLEYETACVELRAKVEEYEESVAAVSRARAAEVDGLLSQQNLLMENIKAEFRSKEEGYVERISELEEYKLKLTESLATIERNAENLKFELERAGRELASSKEQLAVLGEDQERSVGLQVSLAEMKDGYEEILAREREATARLTAELVREKAKKEVDSVVAEAETKVDMITQQQQQQQTVPLFTFPGSNGEDPFDDRISVEPGVPKYLERETATPYHLHQPVEERLRSALEENERLLSIIGGYEAEGRRPPAADKAVELSAVEGSTSVSLHEKRDEEDGWGWGEAESVRLPAADCADDQRIAELEGKLNRLEAENSRLSEELKESRVRSAKLLKKAKELKAKSEREGGGARERSVGFEDLDFAMQEELRGRIDALEKSLSDARNDSKAWKTERDHYQRKIETLTAGNERLVEMKERQDVEAASLLRLNAELGQQVQALEWKLAELAGSADAVNEMEEKLNGLAAENEELVKVLNSMKAVVDKDDRFQLLQEESGRIKQERDGLKELYDAALKSLEDLSKQNSDLLDANKQLDCRFDTFKTEINQLAMENENLKDDLTRYADVSAKCSDVGAEFERLKFENDGRLSALLEENRSMRDTIASSEERIGEYRVKLEEYHRKLEQVDANYRKIRDELESVSKSEESSRRLAAELDSENNLLKCDIERLNKLLSGNTIVDNNILPDAKNSSRLETEAAESVPVLFRGFAADPSAGIDPFEFPNTDTTRSESSGENVAVDSRKEEDDLQRLKEQVSTLNVLLQEKETELEITKQSVDSFKLERDNLRDEWSKRYEDMKVEQNCVHSVMVGKHEEALNEAKQKYQDALLLKEEEIAHLTCELSAARKDADDTSARHLEETAALREECDELQRSLTYEKSERGQVRILENRLREIEGDLKQATLENESLRQELVGLRDESSRLQAALNDTESENRLKSEETSEKLLLSDRGLNECIKMLEEKDKRISELETSRFEESRNSVRQLDEKIKDYELLKEKYDECCRLVEGSQTAVALLEGRLKDYDSLKINLDSAYKRIDELSSRVSATTVQAGVTDEPPPPPSASDSGEEVVGKGNTKTVDDLEQHYREMVRQRDVEIERLIEAVGEAEEARLASGAGTVTGLQLRLDEALYTLHLRDVRCEELTLELMQLLEERDALQLRLSAAIKLNEKSRERLERSPSGLAAVKDQGLADSNSSRDGHGATDLPPSASENLDKLQQKLGELHSVGYRRDLSLQQDRERRFDQQLHLYSVPANKPVSKHTHTQQQYDDGDQQQSSSGFFSWMFGTTNSSNVSSRTDA